MTYILKKHLQHFDREWNDLKKMVWFITKNGSLLRCFFLSDGQSIKRIAVLSKQKYPCKNSVFSNTFLKRFKLRIKNCVQHQSREFSGGFQYTTNNRMEFLVVIKALETIKVIPSQIVVTSDSKYVVDAINKGWLKNWIKKKLGAPKIPIYGLVFTAFTSNTKCNWNG